MPIKSQLEDARKKIFGLAPWVANSILTVMSLHNFFHSCISVRMNNRAFLYFSSLLKMFLFKNTLFTISVFKDGNLKKRISVKLMNFHSYTNAWMRKVIPQYRQINICFKTFGWKRYAGRDMAAVLRKVCEIIFKSSPTYICKIMYCVKYGL